jgi:hypothetical protein
MDEITKPSGNRIGGLSKIQICPVVEITSIPDAVAGVISSAVTFAGAGKWYDVPAAFESLQFTQKSVNSTQGKHYELEVSGFITGQSAALDYLFAQLEQKRIVIKATDMNGNVLLVCQVKAGTITGLRLAVDYDSTSSYSGKKGYSLSFIMLGRNKAYSYTA